MISDIITISLFIFGFYHFVAGIFAIGPHRWLQSFGRQVYHLDIPTVVDPRYFVCLKFLGLMALMVAALSFIVAYGSNKAARELSMLSFGMLFLSRSFFRWIFKKEFFDAYQLEFKRSLWNIIFNSLVALFSIVITWMSYATN